MSDSRPIALFDSGVGGLTVVAQILKKLPNEQFVYLGDTARYPYGPRSVEAIKKMSKECVVVLKQENPKLIIVACNTATAAALEYLQKEFMDVPFIGVVEPCVNAVCDKVKFGDVLVLGTKGTIKSNVYGSKIKEESLSQINVTSKACPLFVPLVEEGQLFGDVLNPVLKLYLKEFKNKINYKAIILACTHYPLIKNAISNYFNSSIEVLDSAEFTVLEVKAYLEKNNLLSNNKNLTIKDSKFMVSDFPMQFRKNGEQFLGTEISFVTKVEL